MISYMKEPGDLFSKAVGLFRLDPIGEAEEESEGETPSGEETQKEGTVAFACVVQCTELYNSALTVGIIHVQYLIIVLSL